MTRNREIDCEDIFGCNHTLEIPITDGNGDILYWQCRCGDKKTDESFKVAWSEEDKEYVGTCARFPSMSWLDPDEKKALEGIKKLVQNVLQDMKRG